jgi:hypothetical protein
MQGKSSDAVRDYARVAAFEGVSTGELLVARK